MDVLFPRVSINYNFDERHRRVEPRDYVGNPKAVAAQTFKSKQAGAILFHAKPWVNFCQIFKIQYLVEKAEAPTILIPQGNSWIMYPYALSEITDERASLVWREQIEPRWIRHVRVYRDQTYALTDNQLISQSIHAFLNLAEGAR